MMILKFVLGINSVLHFIVGTGLGSFIGPKVGFNDDKYAASIYIGSSDKLTTLIINMLYWKGR